MKCLPLKLKDLYLIEPKVHGDERGYFFESFRKDVLARDVGEFEFVQDNESKSSKHILRGFHYQIGEFAQTKLVRVVQGRVLDIVVDIRETSETFGQHLAVELNAENKYQLLIPKGFAHAFLSLSETAIFQYKVDAVYSKESERGFRFDDPELGIKWPVEPSQLECSQKDRALPDFSDAEKFS